MAVKVSQGSPVAGMAKADAEQMSMRFGFAWVVEEEGSFYTYVGNSSAGRPLLRAGDDTQKLLATYAGGVEIPAMKLVDEGGE